LIFLLWLATSSTEAAIVNPSFELFGGSLSIDGALSLPAGTTALTGWNVVGGQIAVLGSTNFWNLTPSDGEYFLDLTGRTAAGAAGFPKGVSQTLTGLTVGQQYSVYMDLGVSNDNAACVLCGGPVSVIASVGGTSATFVHNSVDSGNIWGTYGFSFLASSTAMDLTVLGESAPGIYLGLDNVSVSAVPLPAAFWLLLSAAGIFLFYGASPRTLIMRSVKT
jgi:hypothetical protein